MPPQCVARRWKWEVSQCSGPYGRVFQSSKEKEEMKLNDAQTYFLREATAHAQALPLHQAVIYLEGLLQSVKDSELTAHLRKIYTTLSELDRQIDLIKTGQTNSSSEKKR